MKKPDHTSVIPRPKLSPILGALLAILLCLGISQTVRAQSYAMSNLWSVASGTHWFFTTDQNTRGLAYNPATDHLLVVGRTPTNGVYIMDATNGTVLGSLNVDTNLIKGGNFPVSLIGITDDGVIYVGNLTTDTTNAANGPFRLYRWANEAAAPTLAYSGDPSEVNTNGSSPRRFGDSLALRGTGTGTQILLGTYNKLVILLTTTDGVNFTHTKITTDVAEQDTRFGLAWGPGNSFWCKAAVAGSTPGDLKYVTFDPVAKTGTVVSSVPQASVVGGPLDVDLSRNLLAIVSTYNSTSTAYHKLRLYDISNPAIPIQIDSTKDFPAPQVSNGNGVGAVSIRNGRLYALDTGNGILAYRLQDGITWPVTVGSLPNVTLWDGAENYKYTAVVGGTAPEFQWQFKGVDIPGANSQSYLVPGPVSTNSAGVYTVVVTNAVSRASSSSTLGVQLGNLSGQTTNIWSLAADSRPYLTTAYREYAVAINPLTTNVIVVTSKPNPTNMIAVLDIQTGAHKHYIDYSALSPVSFSKATVADDGVLFVCNQTGDASSSPFKIYGFSDDNPTPAMTGFLFSADPGAGIAPSNIGWGANIDARGGGVETEILVGSGKWAASPITTKYVAILRYNSEMSGFISTPIEVTNAPVSNNTFRFGLCWGPGNTFWVKGNGTGLMQVEYDLAAGKGWIKKQYPTTGVRSVPPSVCGMAYDASTHLLAGLQNGSPPLPVSVEMYDVSDEAKGPFWVDQELFSSYNDDIEFGGTVSFENGYIVALGCNNGLRAMKVNSGFASSLPIIISHPVGGTWFENVSSFSMSVVADSMTPPTYQWYRDSELLSGETGSTISITNIQASQAGNYWARVSTPGGFRDSQPAPVIVVPLHNTAQMTNMWYMAAGTKPYLMDNYYEYGLSFNPANSNLLVAHYVPTNNETIIAVIDAISGADKHYLDITSITNGGNRWLNKIGVADDGVVYAGNRTVSPGSVPFVVYRWADDSAGTVASIAFKGNPFANTYKLAASTNVGWSMDVRGAGVNTEIVLSLPNTNVLAVLTTTDGVNFSSKECVVQGAPVAFARLGICFGEGNTVWTKAWRDQGGELRLVELNKDAGTGTILRTYTPDQVAGAMTTLAYNNSLKFLGGIARDDQKNMLLYSVADLDAGPVLLDQEVFPTYNGSIEANGALDFGGNTYLFGLNENNGIMAMAINPAYVPPVTSFKINSAVQAGNQVTITWEAVNGATYQVQQRDSVSGGTWQNLGSPVTATGSTATYSETIQAGPRFYRVQALTP